MDYVLFICDQCDFKSQTNEGLNNYEKSIHADFKYLCDQCNNKATSKNGLKYIKG